MLGLVTDEAEISTYQRQFMVALDRTRAAVFHCTITWRPGSVAAEVSWSSQGFWWYSGRDETRSIWGNQFGLQAPTDGARLSITCEINFPVAGANPKLAGAFLRDNGGRVFLAHRGRPIGGGKRGITMAGFWQMYSGRTAMANDDGRARRFALVTEVGGNTVAADVRAFLGFVSAFKQSG